MRPWRATLRTRTHKVSPRGRSFCQPAETSVDHSSLYLRSAATAQLYDGTTSIKRDRKEVSTVELKVVSAKRRWRCRGAHCM